MAEVVGMLFGLAVAWMAVGCHLASPQPEDAETVRRFTQVSLFGTLLCGRYGGVVDLGYLEGVNAPGWHLHYIDAEREHGGHVLNFALKGGTLKACTCGQFDIRLPGAPAALSGLDLSRDRAEEPKRSADLAGCNEVFMHWQHCVTTARAPSLHMHVRTYMCLSKSPMKSTMLA